MMEAPLVTIVIPTYNQSRYLPITLDHVLNQDYKKIELIIVNDCSSDDTEKVIKEYVSSLKTEQVSRMDRYENKCGEEVFVRSYSPRLPQNRVIKVLRNETNLGATNTYNRGFMQASGEYSTFIPSDDIPHPLMISRMVSTLEETGADFVYADSIIVDDTGQIMRRLPMPDYDFSRCFGDWYHLGVAKLYRRSLHDRVGYYDEEYRLANDYDMYLRFAQAGARFVHLPEVLYSVRNHGPDRQTGQHSEENWERMYDESARCAKRARVWLKQKSL
ncbi:MAG: glycosyltransferase [Deltaproteobacteria bacterium]|nr:glycosyltransferase [Deltaproteobacteria bacterium]